MEYAPSSLHIVIASHAADVVLAGFTQGFGVTGKAHIHSGAKTNAAPAIELAMLVPQGNSCYSARGNRPLRMAHETTNRDGCTRQYHVC